MPSTLDEKSSSVQRSGFAELLVLWQDPATRAMLPVGVLSYDGHQYRFEYLPAAHRSRDFRPLLGFKDLGASYLSEDLFPLFRERVLDPTRPDFARVVERLDMDASRATPWEQLVRTGGTSEGDTLQVTPVPHAVGEGWACTFLAAGMRYSTTKSVLTARGATGPVTIGEFEASLDRLRPGGVLDLELELNNSYSGDAKLMLHGDAVIAYLPDWLAKLCSAPWKKQVPMEAKVIRVNDRSAGWHLRLLVELTVAEPYAEAAHRLRTETVDAY